MKILSHQGPSFGHAAPLLPTTVEAAVVAMHKLGLTIDRVAQSPPTSLSAGHKSPFLVQAPTLFDAFAFR